MISKYFPGIILKYPGLENGQILNMGFQSFPAMKNLLVDRFATADELVLQPGHASIDQIQCNECGRCLRIGHCHAIESGEGGKPSVRVLDCTACGTCVDICPTGAITLVQTSSGDDPNPL